MYLQSTPPPVVRNHNLWTAGHAHMEPATTKRRHQVWNYVPCNLFIVFLFFGLILIPGGNEPLSSDNSIINLEYKTYMSAVFRHQFLRATAGTAIARLSHRNSVCLSVCLSVTPVDQAKTVQARIIKSSPSKTLVSGSVTLFQKFHRGHPNRWP